MVIRPVPPVAIVSGAYAMTHHCVDDRAARPDASHVSAPFVVGPCVRDCSRGSWSSACWVADRTTAPRHRPPPGVSEAWVSDRVASWTFAAALAGVVAKGVRPAGETSSVS
jgi:hypothetical protein